MLVIWKGQTLSMIKTIKKILNIRWYLKRKYKTNVFRKNSVCGKDTTFGYMASCMNQTGIKTAIQIGNYCDIHAIISVQGKGKIHIGDYTTIRGNSTVGGVELISIGSHVIISNNVHIYDNNNHPTSPRVRWEMCENGFYGSIWNWTESESKPVIIEDNVWIGERSTILKGVTIGHGSIIACDSVVTRDVPAYSIAAGNPANVVKQLNG